MERTVKVKVDERTEDALGLGVDPLPQLHSGDDNGADPQHGLSCELAYLCNEFIQRALAAVEILVRLVYSQLCCTSHIDRKNLLIARCVVLTGRLPSNRPGLPGDQTFSQGDD